jgi:Trypsin
MRWRVGRANVKRRTSGNIGARGRRRGLVVASGLLVVGALAIVLCGVASARVVMRHEPAKSLDVRRMPGWRVVRTRSNHSRIRHVRDARWGRSVARAAIVGGNQISIERAPWQVALVAEVTFVYQGENYFLREVCGGIILDQSRVLTAAHCMFNPLSRSKLPAEDLTVIAGSSDFKTQEAATEVATVSDFRVHPYFAYAPEATRAMSDDVAVLVLSKPLVLDGSVEPVTLAGSGSLAQEGTAAVFTGFGEQSVAPKEMNGRLYSLGMTLAFNASCGGEADALFVCASTPTGSVCIGDSGSGLTVAGSPTALVGVADTVEVISGEPCRDGALGGFANVAAPEIQEFVDGNEVPPKAPRGGAGAQLTASSSPPMPGQSVTCKPGPWSGEPAFTYAFIASQEGHVLQSGDSPVYEVTQADAGLAILCQVDATNAGGTGMQRTNPLPPVSGVSLWSIESARIGGQKAYEAYELEQQKAAEQEAKKRARDEAMVREERETIERENAKAMAEYVARSNCIVPSLKADTLVKAREALAKARCRLGKVVRPRTRHRGVLVVVYQHSPPGKRFSPGTRVGVTLGPANAHKRR